MLSRAALPLLRPRNFHPANRIASSALQTRWYARERRSRVANDYKPPASARIPEWKQVSSQETPLANDIIQETRFGEDRKPPIQEYSKVQAESDTPAIADSSSGRDYTPASPEPDNRTTTQSTLIPEPNERPPEPQSIPDQPLPDLMQGIPSTLGAELKEARRKQFAAQASLNISEDPSEPLPSAGGGHGDGLPKSAYISSSERKRNTLIKYAYLGILGSFVSYALYLGRNWDSEEEERKHTGAPSGWGFGQFYNRVKARLGSTMAYYNEPAFPKLLPDEEKDPNLRAPFTLVVGLEDLLVKEEWSRAAGYRFAKRPGVDYFLRYLSQYYEIVCFTTAPAQMADQVLRKLDPFRMIRWPLGREATLYKNGQHIKDLSYLNRNLAKVILIDTDPASAQNQPENAIIIPKWDGDPNDQTLVQFIPFLEYLATMGIEDARTVLKSFEGKYIPADFARREKALREKFEAQLAEQRGKRPKRGISIGGLFGSSKAPDGIERTEEKMMFDLVRERGQKQYELIDKQIREEGPKWLKEMEEEEKKFQEAAMKDMKSGFFGYFAGGGEKR